MSREIPCMLCGRPTEPLEPPAVKWLTGWEAGPRCPDPRAERFSREVRGGRWAGRTEHRWGLVIGRECRECGAAMSAADCAGAGPCGKDEAAGGA